MNDKKENNYSMQLAVQQVLNDNTAIWSPNTGFAAIKTAYSNKLTDIYNKDQLQIAINTGLAVDKKVLKKLLVDLAAPVASVTVVHATQISDNDLLNSVNFTRTALLESRDNQIAQRCQIIHDKANANIAALTLLGVNAAMLTALQNAINAYAAKAATPAAAKAAKKANAIDLNNLFKDTDSILKMQLDKIMEPYKATNLTFYNAYKAARLIPDLGATHTNMNVIVKDESSQVLPGASVSLLQTGLVVYHGLSGANGAVKFPKVKPGTYDLKVERANFTTKTILGIFFVAGKGVKRTVNLVPGSPVGLITLSREADVAANTIAPVDITGINTTGLTLVSLEVTLGPLSLSASNTSGVMGLPFSLVL